MKRDSMVFYRSFRESLRELPPELYREVSEMLFDYAFDGIEPMTDANPVAKAFFVTWRGVVDAANDRYDKCVANGKKGGAPKGNDNARKQPKNNQETTVNKEYGIRNKKYIEKSTNVDTKKTGKRFSPPSLSEVSEYITTNGYTVDAAHFIDYYEANGWKVGRNPMKDWRAAVRTWQQREQADNRTRRTTGKPQQSNGVTLGYDERIEPDGRRTYGTGKVTIPPDAPPRPSGRYAWDTATRKWILL